uniref:Uncharacterized protein n=1 Tax=Lotus japonicus TaxID=34305 RepID=I3SMH5_LOTJA|nr:unknown [Lotus japonicus]
MDRAGHKYFYTRPKEGVSQTKEAMAGTDKTLRILALPFRRTRKPAGRFFWICLIYIGICALVVRPKCRKSPYHDQPL